MIARKQGDHFILNGVKNWVVAAPLADLAVVWAQVHITKRYSILQTESIPGKVLTRIGRLTITWIKPPFSVGEGHHEVACGQFQIRD